MKSLPLILLLSLAFSFSFGQNVNLKKALRKLKKVGSTSKAEQFLEEFPSFQGKISVIFPEIDTGSSYSTLLPAIRKRDFYHFFSKHDNSDVYVKPLEWEYSRLYKVRYIFLDNARLSKSEIDSLRAVIMNRLKGGESFIDLVKEYSMDSNAQNGGELGWFIEGIMMKPFMDQVKSHSRGDVYFADVPEKKWYYIVFNDFDPITSKGLNYLTVRIKR